MMVIGRGGSGKSALNPFDAVGLKTFIQMNKEMSGGNNCTTNKR